MFRSGDSVAEHLRPHDGGELEEKQIQPNGVDLTLDKVLQLEGMAVIGDDTYSLPVRTEATRVGTDHPDVDEEDHIEIEQAYSLNPGGYVAVYNEEVIEIPENHIGIVWPRSRLLRSAAHLTTAVWDTGYSGRGEGALLVNHETLLQEDMRIGQMTLVEAESFGKYEGQHQGERLDG